MSLCLGWAWQQRNLYISCKSQHSGSGRHFFPLCFILYMTASSFSSSLIANFQWLTQWYDDGFFWSKMLTIFTKNVRKHCLHACSFLRVFTELENSLEKSEIYKCRYCSNKEKLYPVFVLFDQYLTICHCFIIYVASFNTIAFINLNCNTNESYDNCWTSYFQPNHQIWTWIISINGVLFH